MKESQVYEKSKLKSERKLSSCHLLNFDIHVMIMIQIFDLNLFNIIMKSLKLIREAFNC